MYLPNEIHDEILRHVARTDLPVYRLICRDFASPGARSLFRWIHYKASIPSLKRLATISRQDSIASLVETLVWDTNNCEFEPETFLEGLRTRELKFLLDGASARRRKTPEISDVEENVTLSRSLGVFLLQAIFSGFSRLQEVYILTNDHPVREATVEKWHRKSNISSADPDWYPTDEACSALWKADQGNGQPFQTGWYEMHAALLAAHLAGCPISKIRVGYIFWEPQSPEGFWPGVGHAFERLTSLRFMMSFPREALWPWRQGANETGATNPSLESLKSFLETVPNLRTLELALDRSNWTEGDFYQRANLRLQDIIPSPQHFPCLNEMILDRCDTSEEFLVDFLREHRRTMKLLKMNTIRFDPGGSWPRLFDTVRSFLQLDDIWLHGYFFDSVRFDASVMDMNRLKGSMEKHVLHK